MNESHTNSEGIGNTKDKHCKSHNKWDGKLKRINPKLQRHFEILNPTETKSEILAFFRVFFPSKFVY